MNNWAGNFTYSTEALREAGSIEEIQDCIRSFGRFKVLGTRHCFNDIANSKDQLVTLGGMNGIADLDTDRQTVTVAAGVRYGELAVWLESRGYALHNLASLPHISVVGGCATATHGSGVGNGNLATAVRAMEFVDGKGRLVQLGAGDMEAAAVHLGALGVITSITLAVEPSYTIRQTVYEDLSMGALETGFDAIMSAGYSVSLFTNWQGPLINEVWVKRKERGGADFFGARAADRDLHPIGALSAEHCTTQQDIPGPWHERLPHFKMGFTPSSGQELQSEYFVPREYSYSAVKAIGELRERIAPLLLISEIRSVAADRLWMSPSYGRETTAFHFTWKPDWAGVREVLPLIEEKLASFYVRPHWGKLFTMASSEVQAQYEKLPAFRELTRQYDPAGKFRNDFIARIC